MKRMTDAVIRFLYGVGCYNAIALVKSAVYDAATRKFG